MVYFVRGEDCWEGVPHWLIKGINKEYIFIGTRPFGKTKSKAMRAYI